MNSIQGSLHIYNIHVHVVMLKIRSVYTLTTSMLQPAVGYDCYCCYVVYTCYQRMFFRKGTIVFTYTVVTYTLHAKKMAAHYRYHLSYINIRWFTIAFFGVCVLPTR